LAFKSSGVLRHCCAGSYASVWSFGPRDCTGVRAKWRISSPLKSSLHSGSSRPGGSSLRMHWGVLLLGLLHHRMADRTASACSGMVFSSEFGRVLSSGDVKWAVAFPNRSAGHGVSTFVVTFEEQPVRDVVRLMLAVMLVLVVGRGISEPSPGQFSVGLSGSRAADNLALLRWPTPTLQLNDNVNNQDVQY
jgi:hypothetical protein